MTRDLSGSSFSTSAFFLLSRKGRMTWCSLWMISSSSSSLSAMSSWDPLNGAENQSSKESEVSKTLGRTKFSRLYNSFRLFWIGVPVSKSLFLDWYTPLRISESFESLFFSLWPSSMMMYSHWYLVRNFLSLMIMS